MAYTSVSAVKRYLGIPAATTDDDVLIAEFIDAAQAAIDDGTGLTFEAASDSTLYFDAVKNVDGRELTFDGDYFCTITSIVNGDGTTVTSDQYVRNPRNTDNCYSVTLLSSSGVSWTYTDDPENAIAVTGRAAYMETPDAKVEDVCRSMVVAKYRRRENRTGEDDRVVVVGNATFLPPVEIERFIKALPRRIT